MKRLDPAASVTANAARILRVRVRELRSFDPAVRDPHQVKALHDMRIAAKRLRYVLEICGHCFEEAGARAEDEARWLQEVLGEIHDADVLVPRIEAELVRMRREDIAALAAGVDGVDELPRRARLAPNARRYRGLQTLTAAVLARRDLLYRGFLERWDPISQPTLRALMEATIGTADR